MEKTDQKSPKEIPAKPKRADETPEKDRDEIDDSGHVLRVETEVVEEQSKE